MTRWIHFDIFIQGVCADGPGQSKITQMVSHNGYFVCRVCEMEGRYESINRTCTYPWSSFEHTCPSFRTKNLFEWCLKETDRLKIIGDKYINIYGIKGVSPLNQLIFIPTQALYDYFHLCLEILKYCSSFSIYVKSSYLRNMYMTPTNNRNASQSIVRTSNSSSQHPQIFQQQHSTQQQHSVIRQPSSQVTNLFGPVRSSPTR
ncbi:unnamed protein product, partial [Rotaria magnacalcarata]